MKMGAFHSPRQKIKLPSSPHSLSLWTDGGAYWGTEVKRPHTTQSSLELQNSYLCPQAWLYFPGRILHKFKGRETREGKPESTDLADMRGCTKVTGKQLS